MRVGSILFVTVIAKFGDFDYYDDSDAGKFNFLRNLTVIFTLS